MKIRILLLFILLSSTCFPFTSVFSYNIQSADPGKVSYIGSPTQQNPRVLLPIYVRLQALQKNNVTFWQSVPQNFTDHVATIDSKVLAVFIQSNSLSLNLSNDKVGNLWAASEYSLKAGDSISTLTWVSSQTISENLTSIGPVPFPSDYPEDVGPFLEDGSPKIPIQDQAIQQLAAEYKTQNMTQTVRNVIDSASEQQYDPEKTRLLMSGNLTESNILDFFKSALEVFESNSSICIERSWYATSILRAAGVPTRTVTDVRLKTWIQVWLPKYGWVDSEALCAQPPPMFPRPLSTSTPWMIENSSDARFPFTWSPATPMKVANLTFGDVEDFDFNQYRTVLSEPIDLELFNQDPTKFSFPIVAKPEIVFAAVTREGSGFNFMLIKGKENVSEVLTLGKSKSITLGNIAVSFKPIHQQNFLLLQDFTVQEIPNFDVRILVPIVGVPLAIVLVIVFFYRKRRKH